MELAEKLSKEKDIVGFGPTANFLCGICIVMPVTDDGRLER
jgi:hypothetical protein